MKRNIGLMAVIAALAFSTVSYAEQGFYLEPQVAGYNGEDDSSNAAGLSVGYQFTDRWGVEASTWGGVVSSDPAFNYSGIQRLGATITQPVYGKISVTAGAGVSYVKTAGKSSTDAYLGVGLQYALTDRIVTELDYSFQGDDIALPTLGLRYTF